MPICKIYLFLFALFVLSAGCEIDNVDLSGNNALQPDCERLRTARVQFQNRSQTNKTLTVVWDGSVKATLPPGSNSILFTEAAGQHTLTFKVAGTTTTACTQSSPVLIQCYDHVYSCSY